MNPSRIVALIAVLFTGFSISRGTAAAEVSFAVTDSWSTGFNGQLTITNNGPAAVNGWSLEFDFPGTITNIWNGAITSHPGTRYVLGNANYNAAIAVGSTVVIGFSADPANAAHPPTGFVFNGVPVGGGGVNPSTPFLPLAEPHFSPSCAPTVKSNFHGASLNPERRGWRSATETTNRKENVEGMSDWRTLSKPGETVA